MVERPKTAGNNNNPETRKIKSSREPSEDDPAKQNGNPLAKDTHQREPPEDVMPTIFDQGYGVPHESPETSAKTDSDEHLVMPTRKRQHRFHLPGHDVACGLIGCRQRWRSGGGPGHSPGGACETSEGGRIS